MKRFLISLAALAIVACASDQPKKVDGAPTSKEEGGTSPVGVIPTTLLHDAQRNRDVDVAIDYPTRGGPFPVIIFSHGYGAPVRSYEPLVAYWTTRNYVVIRPMHTDVGAIREAPRDLAAERREREQAQSRSKKDKTPLPPPVFRPNPAEVIWDREREPQWRDRVRDITLVIDSLPGLEERFPELKGKIDRTKIGVGGHSYGAFTAMLVGGAKTFGNPPLQLADPRVTAILVLSPPGIASNRGLTAESWREVKAPAMFMTGSRDFGALETETPDWRKAAYENSPAGDKYFVMIQGAHYSTFTGVASLAPDYLPNPSMMQTRDPITGQIISPELSNNPRNTSYIPERGLFDRVRVISLAFWDASLKNDAKAKERLTAGQYGGSVTVEKK
jgi:dienelactone hydrolase